jgi:hypothetical protein
MNGKTHYALSFYHLGLSIRDTLEYVQNRPEYPVNVFNAKKNTIELALKENSPFSGFCANNGEVGVKIKEQLKEMYDTCYGEDKTFLSIEGDKVVPDHAQNLKVLDYILPLKQSCYNILRAYIEDQKKDGSLEAGVEEIVDLEDKFYRAIVSMILADLLFNVHFVEFNKAMQESKGQETPQSNFCVNDIKKVIGMYNFVKQNSRGFEEFETADKGMQFGFELISGQKQVPAGSSMPAEFNKIVKGWYDVVAKFEPVWREKHAVIWNELVKFEQEQMKAAQEAAQGK